MLFCDWIAVAVLAARIGTKKAKIVLLKNYPSQAKANALSFVILISCLFNAISFL